MIDLFLGQVMDPFRIGLICALVYTMLRNRHATGVLLPLCAGIVFVALMLPMTMGRGAYDDAPLWQIVGVGIVVNAVMVAIAMAAVAGVSRLRR